MMRIESYVEMEPGTPVSWDLQEADEQVEVCVGSRLGMSSAVRLVFPDAVTLTHMITELIEARDRLAHFIADKSGSECSTLA